MDNTVLTSLEPTKLKDDIIIKNIYTVYYFEYTKDYCFHGERHNFWEMLYVDKGEAIATAENKEILLKQGDIIFHKPNEWHRIRANNKVAPNFFIMTFDCRSKAMKQFEEKIFTVGETQKSLLSKILNECTKAFENPISEQIERSLKKKSSMPFGTQQLIKIYLTEFLISLVRKDDSKTCLLLKRHTDNDMFNAIIDFMQQNISGHLTLDDIVMYSALSRSSVKKLFKNTAQMGVIEYFIKMKMDYAKKYIREGDYNMTQIASMLGYDNIHYFSKQFSQKNGLSPTEYAKSIKARSQTINSDFAKKEPGKFI